MPRKSGRRAESFLPRSQSETTRWVRSVWPPQWTEPVLPPRPCRHLRAEGDRHRLLCRLVVDPLHQASEDTGLVGRWQRLPDRHERFGSNSGSQLLDMPQVHRKTAIIMQL